MPISPSYLHKRGHSKLSYCVCWGSAGSVLGALRRLGGGMGFRAVREGIVVIASKARCGPIPLRWAYLCGRSQEGSGKVRHSECPNGAPHV
jgi:hypothetical protein